MIKIPKKRLYNSLRPPFFCVHRNRRVEIAAHAAFIFLFYLFFPTLLGLKSIVGPAGLFIFYAAIALITIFLAKINNKNKARLSIQAQQNQERINTVTDRINKENNTKTALEFKISRYNSLKEITQQIDNTFDLEVMTNNLVDFSFNRIGRRRGVCLLYLIDSSRQRLQLSACRKEDTDLIIKAKEGDIFDLWVLKHASALFIEDIRKDFRFDIEKIGREERRDIASLIGSPLASENRLLGVIRLDNPQAQFFSQDDIRFLNTISDLGAVALENLELFKTTQELAIRDDLTRLYRKGYFLQRLKEEFRRVQKKKQDICLLMIDIDHFKDYNDRFGHTAGDIVLRVLSCMMGEFFEKENPVLCRFGGEEFCVLLPATGKKKALILAQRLRNLIHNKEITLRRQRTNITVSLGLAAYPQDASCEEELMRKADSLLYQAKQKGRNRVCST